MGVNGAGKSTLLKIDRRRRAQPDSTAAVAVGGERQASATSRSTRSTLLDPELTVFEQ